jgi:hypothetical protein
MTRAIAVVACGLGLACLGLASCTSSIPSFDVFASKPTTTTLTIESDPPGAQANASVGGTCLTPCALAVPSAGEFTVSYTLAGYLPQTVAVRAVRGERAGVDRRQDTFEGLTDADVAPAPVARLDPNPVFAALRPAAPSKPPARRRQPPADTGAAFPSDGGLPPPPGAR